MLHVVVTNVLHIMGGKDVASWDAFANGDVKEEFLSPRAFLKSALGRKIGILWIHHHFKHHSVGLLGLGCTRLLPLRAKDGRNYLLVKGVVSRTRNGNDLNVMFWSPQFCIVSGKNAQCITQQGSRFSNKDFRGTPA